MKRVLKWLAGVPHLFGKLIVGWCVLFGTLAVFYSLYICHRAALNPESTLRAGMLLFCGELTLSVWNKKKNNTNKPEGF